MCTGHRRNGSEEPGMTISSQGETWRKWQGQGQGEKGQEDPSPEGSVLGGNHRRAQWLDTEDPLLLTVLWSGGGSFPSCPALMQLHSAVGGSAGLGPLGGWARWASLCRRALGPAPDWPISQHSVGAGWQSLLRPRLHVCTQHLTAFCSSKQALRPPD